MDPLLLDTLSFVSQLPMSYIVYLISRLVVLLSCSWAFCCFFAAEVCQTSSPSKSTSNVVPIAVGCALAGLIIIVLIAYLIGRRKSKEPGYQQL